MTGGTAIEFAALFTHPDYEDTNFALHDLGVVILQQPVLLPTYGPLPQAGLLDGLAILTSDERFTAYGVETHW